MVFPISPHDPQDDPPAPSDPIPDAIARCHTGVLSLPSNFPRPEELLSPRSEMAMEEWKRREAAVREKLDAIVLSWLESDLWPSDLDEGDDFLILLRIQFARDWLEVSYGLADVPMSSFELLQELLIRLWADYFLDRHLQALFYRVCAFSCGVSSCEHQ